VSNLHAIGMVLAVQALAREETRGSHWREDFPATDDRHWRVRLIARAEPDGAIRTWREPVPDHDYSTPGM
jgi:succinate dehydrogenase/fumarate reductase flavoprotein subunit